MKINIDLTKIGADLKDKFLTKVIEWTLFLLVGYCVHWGWQAAHVIKSEPKDIMTLNQKVDSVRTDFKGMKMDVDNFMFEMKYGYVPIKRFRIHEQRDSACRLAIWNALKHK